jgi:predicted ArsR family transcriptional regulator
MAQEQDLDALGVFTEPQRRRVFEHVQLSGPCTVSELVDALGLGRTLVAFHLGKLVEASFVEVIASDSGSKRPGRPAQRYRVTGREVVATVPDRRYDLLAGILLDSVAHFRAGETAQASALRAARRRGAELARQLGGGGRRGRTPAALLGRLERLLSQLGYAPQRQGVELAVRNCPFDKFRATNTAQVCALNKALSDGYLHGLELDKELQTTLQPSADRCCVVFAVTAE